MVNDRKTGAAKNKDAGPLIGYLDLAAPIAALG